jgi:hypothetical protein
MDDNAKYLGNATTTAILVDAGIEMMRQNIKRHDPTLPEERIDALLSSWLCRADDPIPGDTAGDVRIRERAS